MEETEAEQQATIQAQCQLQEELNVLRAEYLAREQQFQVELWFSVGSHSIGPGI